MANGNFGGGNGTSASPWMVEDQADFFAISSSPNAYYKFKNDITLTSRTPQINNFSGQLDGDNHVLSGLNPLSTSWIATLSGILKNINIKDPTLNVTLNSVHSLICLTMSGSAQIYSVNITGTYTLASTTSTSPTVYLHSGTTPSTSSSIVNCHVYSTNTVSINRGSIYVFGGNSVSTTVYSIFNSSNYLNINSYSDCSFAYGGCSDCINYGNFSSSGTASLRVSGISTNGNALRCSNYGNIVAQYSSSVTIYAAGITTSPQAIDCVNYGNVTGGRYVSGIISPPSANSSATRCICYGDVTCIPASSYSSYFVGGILSHQSQSTPTVDCFFAGNISINSSSINTYYGNAFADSSTNTRLKILNTSQITIGG